MDEGHFSAIVAKHFEHARCLASVRLMGGVSADVFKLTIESSVHGIRDVVLRIHGASHSGHPASLEFELLNKLYEQRVAVPEPLALDVSEEIVPYPYILMAFVVGTTKVTPDFQARAIQLMAEALSDLHHRCRKLLHSLPGLPVRSSPLPELLDYLPEGEAWTNLRVRLKQLGSLAPPAESTLLHGDYWPENVMWRDDKIVAIVDWEDAAVGDPLSDVACCRLELSYLYGAQGADAFLLHYRQRLSALQGEAVDEYRLLLWQIYVAAAAQKFMGQWRLPEEKEAHMRATALALIETSAEQLRRFN